MSNDGQKLRLRGPSGQVDVVAALGELGLTDEGNSPGVCTDGDGAVQVDVEELFEPTGTVLVKVLDMSVDEDSPLLDDLGARDRIVDGLRRVRPGWELSLDS